MTADYLTILFWSIILFIGYYGLGELFFRQFKNEISFSGGWALKSIIGVCITIFSCSILMLFRQCNYLAILTLSLITFTLGIYFLYQNLSKYLLWNYSKKNLKVKNRNERSRLGMFILIPSLLTLLVFITSIYWPFQYDPNDDWIAYLSFPKILLDTGTLIEPFSSRRILGLCGQSILLAQIMIVAPPESAHLLDRGYGVVLLFGLLLEATRTVGHGWQLLRAIVILAAVTASVPRINSASSQLGIALLFGFVLLVAKLIQKQSWSWRLCLIPGILLAGASSLRPTFAMTGGGILIIFFLWHTFKATPAERLNTIKPLIRIGIITFSLLVPLMIVSWESSRTPMFPFFTGNAVPEFIYWNTKKGFLEDAVVAINFMLMPEMIVMSLGFLLVFLLKGKTRTLAISIAIASILIVFLGAVKTSGTASFWVMDLYRYSYPIYAFAFFFIITMCLEIKDEDHSFTGPAMGGLLIAIFWAAHLEAASKELQAAISSIPQQFNGFKFPTSSLEPFYRQLQNMAPPGEKIFAVVDAPYLLDYSRNEISNVDVVAYASPSPGMPFHQGSEALRNYLLSLGYNYILAVDFNKAVFLYNRNAMENHPRPEYRDHAKRYVLDFLNNIDALAEKNTIASNDNCRLISLR